MTILRAMTPADHPAVAAISAEAGRQGLVAMPWWETAEEVAATVAALPGAAFLVAETEGRVTGMAGFDLRTDGEARLYGPLVTTEGHGIGAWLMNSIETLAAEQGAHTYSMLIGLENRGGAAWAEWQGYQPDSEAPKLCFMWVAPGELRLPAHAPGAAVRAAAPADLESVVALCQECFPNRPVSRAVWQTWLADTLILERGGEVLGLCRVERATRMLHHVCTSPSARRQGLAADLVARAVARQWEQDGPVRVGLSVRQDNGPAVTLFRKLGFGREIPAGRWVKRHSLPD